MSDRAAPAGLLSGHFRCVQKGNDTGSSVIEDAARSAEDIAQRLAEKLELFGLDVVAPLTLSW